MILFYRGAALLIGCWDLLIHSIALCSLILMFGRTPQTSTELTPTNNDLYRRAPIPRFETYSDSSSNSAINNKHIISDHELFNHFPERLNKTHPVIEINARNFYSHWDLMTIHWVQGLSQRM